MGIANMRLLLDALGNPEKKFKVIHVAGTNGKGSVCKFLSEILKKHGYSISVYTSPHLLKYNERFEANGRYITDEEYKFYKNKVKNAIEILQKKGFEAPTLFDELTAIAYLFFKEQNTDFVILETGLGGRLDSTNTIKKPIATIITEIGIDHIKELGSSIESITKEKAGIIKAGVPIITGVTNKKAREIIIEKAKEKKALFIDALPYQSDIPKLEMQGKHQIRNASVAMATIDILDKNGHIKIDRNLTLEAIRGAKKSGRYELLSKNPDLIIDAGHNLSGILAVINTFDLYNSNLKNTKHGLTLIIGFMQDKQYEEMTDLIQRSFKSYNPIYIITKPESERGMDPDIIKEILISKGERNVHSIENNEDAYDMAKKLKKNITLSFGSIYLIGNIKTYFIKKGW
ncbi:bifunctional folylpolyglutamate synthase/dihydrofolate synthase [Alterileibacterium massiliense]|uniref:bifunctional folylpolyglutamate synthase/dihydrofolate synthase n=1 Tax=Alterileibacterium massiliense TaxID=1870997 RepID=UPI0008DAC836|nr:folylpolyglutamate synthase/dihydrofolate synthase family protein [Alterileibacterium massiliense]